MLAVEQSKSVVAEARAWLAAYRAEVRLGESDKVGEAEPF